MKRPINHDKSANESPVGLILMTAMPPTKGHAALIEFAQQFLEIAERRPTLHVIVCGRTFEPMAIEDRVEALTEFVSSTWHGRTTLIHAVIDDNAPQNPSESASETEFWQYWKNLAESVTHGVPYDYVFASEEYGIKLAEVLGAEFIPFDVDRELVEVKAQWFRNNPLENFDMLLPKAVRFFQQEVIMFGAESVGKTTTSRVLAEDLFGHEQVTHTTEWARPYLEMTDLHGGGVTDQQMRVIAYGQNALDWAARDQNKPVIIKDTDLLSTIGYYRIMEAERLGVDPLDVKSEPEFIKVMFELQRRYNRHRLYVMLNSKNIPFTKDPLRYGGDKRESTDEFWIKLLEEYGCDYIHCDLSVGPRNHELLRIKIKTLVQDPILQRLKTIYDPLSNFVRT